jgi:hypothetical protein
VSSGGEDLDQRRGKRGREQVLQVLSHVGIRDARAEELLSGRVSGHFVRGLRAIRQGRDRPGLLHRSDGWKPVATPMSHRCGIDSVSARLAPRRGRVAVNTVRGSTAPRGNHARST